MASSHLLALAGTKVLTAFTTGATCVPLTFRVTAGPPLGLVSTMSPSGNFCAVLTRVNVSEVLPLTGAVRLLEGTDTLSHEGAVAVTYWPALA